MREPSPALIAQFETEGKGATRNVHEIMDEMVKRPTLDQLLDRHPGTLKFPDDYVPHVDELRRQRAMFIKSEQEKKAGKDKYKMPDTTEEIDDAASET